MAHLFQVGVGSGGIAVLDAVCRDERITRITLLDPDEYEPHNVARHLFPASAVGRLKVDLAAEWVRQFRPEVEVTALPYDLTDPARRDEIETFAATCDLGVCAADNEPAKYHFDELLRRHRAPWTLGEVLAGGIGGWVHAFPADGPCYGCVASHLQRGGPADAVPEPPPDYANPNGRVAATRIPASRASVAAVAGLHAVATLEFLSAVPVPCGSLLVALAAVPGVFDVPFRTRRVLVPKDLGCLLCSAVPVPSAGEGLDVALDQALARLGYD